MSARRLANAATAAGMRPLWNHEPSWWLRCRLVDLTTRLSTGTLPTCGHLAIPASVALWDGVARCRGCMPSSRLIGDADRTCDRCGHLCRGVIYPVVLALGAVVVSFGLCPACHDREAAR